MESEPKRRFRLILDYKCQFPEKLFDVANDGHLIYWNRDDSVFIRNDDEFEQNVMKLYPGFVKIPSVLNLKRLFREYGFERDIGPNGLLKFSHPCFQRGRRELLHDIKTRRKSFRSPQYWKAEDTNDAVVIDAEDGKRYSTRKRRKTSRFNGTPLKSTSYTSGNIDAGGCGDFTKNSPAIYCIQKPSAAKQNIVVPNYHTGTPVQVDNPLPTQISVPTPNAPTSATISKPDLQVMMDRYASNEFSEHEYNQWLGKQRKSDEAREDSNVQKTSERSKDFWWMYGDKPTESDANNSSTTTETVNQDDTCMPCGFCKCCSAISNYVHIFGEVPENIQVYDFVEEVIEVEAGEQSAETVAPQTAT